MTISRNMAVASMTLFVACAGSDRRMADSSRQHLRSTSQGRQSDALVDDLAISDVQQQAQGGRRQVMKLSMNSSRATNCKRWLPIAQAAGRRFGVDPWMLLAIAWVESGFSNQAVSSVGARGPMQLMPKTSVAFGCAHPQRPHCAFPAAAALYRRLLKRFGAREVYALCAYNAGGGRIASAWRGRRLPFNLWYAERVQAARARLKRTGCVPGA